MSCSFHLTNLNLLYVDVEENVDENLKLFNAYFNEIFVSSDLSRIQSFLKNEIIDLVIIDIEACGIELLKEIKKLDDNISILAFSKFKDNNLFLDTIKLCIDGYIIKPIELKQLDTSLNKIIEKHTVDKKIKNNENYINQYSEIIDNTAIISKTDLSGKITYVNDNFCRITGYNKDELIGKNHNILRHKDTPSDIYRNIWDTIKNKKRTWYGILKNVSKNGEIYYSNSVIKPLMDHNGKILEFVSFRNSIDVVLDNKKHLLNEIELNILSCLVLVQIQEFDMLEKFYNIAKIDNLERSFASHLISYLPDSNLFENVYTLGNGRFALLTDYSRFDKVSFNIKEYLEQFVKNVRDSVLEIDDVEYDLTIVLSYAFGKYNLYEDAKAGLEEAVNKNKAINYSNDYSIKTNKDAKKNFEIIKMVKIALDNYKIVSYIQPIINNKTRKVDKYESLVRLIDEDGNVVSPYKFLDVTKKGTYYNKITSRVLENSFKMLEYINTKLSINLSLLDIEKRETRIEIFELLEQYESENHRIVFELLEDENVRDFRSIKRFIRKVKNKGVQIAIDDFGTGYSNFERLLDFEPDILKIDGSLIKNIVDDKFSRNIIETIVEFCKKQNILTIAEFVENETIFNMLTQMGVDFSQGYYFGQPEALNQKVNEVENIN